MNIYIYGNQSFKKEIHETLEHSNIKFKLDSNTLITELKSLNELKEAIENNPKDVYIIDDEKIIKKNSLNKKIKFLAPKDGIEEEFLLDSGIADLSIDSLKEIPKYILKKYEEEKRNQENISSTEEPSGEEIKEEESLELDEELSQLLSKEETPKENPPKNLKDTFDLGSPVDLNELENLIASDEKDGSSMEEFVGLEDFNDNFGLNNISLDYDDKNIEDKSSDEKDPFENFDNEENEEDKMFDDLDFLEDVFNNQEEKTKEEDIKEHVNEKESLDESLQGEGNMSNDKFFELDSLNEEDLLDALNCTVNKKVEEINTKDLAEKNTNSINITNSSNTDELAQLISKLLSNKTLEITIKIKD